MRAIRVLHCITDLSPDGAQRTLLRLLSGLDPGTFESRVVCLKGGDSLEPLFRRSGIPVLQLDVERGVSMIPRLMTLRSIFRRWQPDLVQGWMYHGNIAALITSRFFRSPVPVLWNIRRCLYDITKDRLGTQCAIRLGAQLS